MITVKVKFLGPLYELTRQRNVAIILDENCRVVDLLKKLVEKYGTEFEQEIFESDALISSYILLLNGKPVRSAQEELFKLLKSQDELTILPLLGGG